MKLKELLNAGYNPMNDEIFGCAKGGFAWKHEERHRQQFSKSIIHQIDFSTTQIAFFCGTIGLGLIALDFQLRTFTLTMLGIFTIAIGYIPSLLFNIGLEIDAVIYQLKK
jgi:hypothetical protein